MGRRMMGVGRGKGREGGGKVYISKEKKEEVNKKRKKEWG
jgi:hypothetical protein